jgi:hypothetical protein
MPKHKFSAPERFGVWQAFDGQCFWCGKPVAYIDVTIDHVVPESLEDKLESLAEIRATYALGEDFQVNSFQNWVPCHGNCNSSKGARLYGPSPAMVAILEMVSRRAESAGTIARRATDDWNKGRILGKLESAIEAKLITRDEVMALLGDVEQAPMYVGTEAALELAPGWTVVRSINGITTVTDGRRAGVTPVGPNPHYSWECPSCGSYGPWNGVICMSCNRKSDPWD